MFEKAFGLVVRFDGRAEYWFFFIQCMSTKSFGPYSIEALSASDNALKCSVR